MFNPDAPPCARADPDVIAALRARIARLGGASGAGSVPYVASEQSADDAAGDDPSSRSSSHQKSSSGFPGVLTFGIDAVDEALPWGGLPRAGLHEIIAGDGSAAAVGFCAVWLARLLDGGGSVLWCRRGRTLYPPGLAAFGLDPRRLIVVHGRKDMDLFWAMEEALRSGAVAGVVGEIDGLRSGAASAPVCSGPAPSPTAPSPTAPSTTGATTTALRRLQLAAETRGVMALLLHPRTPLRWATPALTRWRVDAAPSAAATPAGEASFADRSLSSFLSLLLRAPAQTRWRVTLERCKSGVPGVTARPLKRLKDEAPKEKGTAVPAARWPASWLLDCDETGHLRMAAEFRHRQAEPPARRPASATASGIRAHPWG